jgi:hypothetical protein
MNPLRTLIRPTTLFKSTFNVLSNSRKQSSQSMSVAPNKPGVKQDARHEGDTTVTVPNLSASYALLSSLFPQIQQVLNEAGYRVMLIAPLRTRTEDGYDYRVLLLQRNKGSSTFNSAHVFPGKSLTPRCASSCC